MRSLALGSQYSIALAFRSGKRLIALRPVPPSLTLDRAPFGIEVVQVGCTSRAVHRALDTPAAFHGSTTLGHNCSKMASSLDTAAMLDGPMSSPTVPSLLVCVAGGKPSCTNWQNQRTRPLISRRIMRTYLVLAASASLCQSRLSFGSSISGSTRPP